MTPLEPGPDDAAAVTVNHTGLDRPLSITGM